MVGERSGLGMLLHDDRPSSGPFSLNPIYLPNESGRLLKQMQPRSQILQQCQAHMLVVPPLNDATFAAIRV